MLKRTGTYGSWASMDKKQEEGMIETILVASPEEYLPKLREAEALASSTNKSLFLLFTGSKNASGRSWCPDCTAAEPVIEEALSSIPNGCVLLTSEVEREPYRSSDYPYRKDSSIRLSCVPTLIKWKNGKVLARLNDSQSQIADLVAELVEA